MLPIGKIIDDLAYYYEKNFSSHLKNYEDMVDAEILSYLVMGINDCHSGQRKPVHFFSYYPIKKDDIENRLAITLAVVRDVERDLNQKLEKYPGKLYLIDRQNPIIPEPIRLCLPILLLETAKREKF